LDEINAIFRIRKDFVYCDFLTENDKTLLIYSRSNLQTSTVIDNDDADNDDDESKISLLVSININQQNQLHRQKSAIQKKLHLSSSLTEKLVGPLYPTEERVFNETHTTYPRDYIMRTKLV
jgi:hypothetical protein